MKSSQRIVRITTWIAGVAAVAVTLTPPLGYFIVSYQFLAGKLEAEAEIRSHIIADVINTNPDLWQYEQMRLEEILSRRMRDNRPETRRILTLQNKLIAESAVPLKPPLITRKSELLDSGVPVGMLEISTSLYSLLFRSFLVVLLGLFCGVLIFAALRVLPLRAVALAEKSLRESEEKLTEKVAQLEATMAKMKHLEGIIPICMYCKKIRDDMESWQQLEGYISEHSEAHFSHGICPECYQNIAAEELKELKKNLKQR